MKKYALYIMGAIKRLINSDSEYEPSDDDIVKRDDVTIEEIHIRLCALERQLQRLLLKTRILENKN